MKLATVEHIRRPAARAEAWKRRALRMEEDRNALGYALAAEPDDCPNCETLREEIRELEREARDEARGAYGEGLARGREESGGDW